jgi:hypothetical protein
MVLIKYLQVFHLPKTRDLKLFRSTGQHSKRLAGLAEPDAVFTMQEQSWKRLRNANLSLLFAKLKLIKE